MFRIKICGITNVKDAIAARDAGADAIGLNFYPRSPRCVSADLARTIRDEVGRQIQCVGVFVNETAGRIESIAGFVGLDTVQLHGDEPVSILNDLTSILVIKAFRIRHNNLDVVKTFLEAAGSTRSSLGGILLDSFDPQHYGGTGKPLDAATLATKLSTLGEYPWCLAGGLRPDNVAEAIRVSRPDAVDTASGVELIPGRKDTHAMRDFVIRARHAFESL
jgi:phosphoribosylanthranilate isomerase